ncbi:MAG: glycosyltransferase family 1 protein [Chloroflexia bacterium]|nr:glycosyltransferase family 1 protein [Chloroflexia bacterium]
MHFAIISAPVPGHLFPCCMLSKGLQEKGHSVTVYNIADSEDFVRNLGFGFKTIGEKEFPKGSWHKRWKPAMTGSNIWRDTRILKAHIEIAAIMLRDLPEMLGNDNVDVLLVDHLQPQGSSLAEKLNIPFITICSILPLHNDPTGQVPASFAWWEVKPNRFNRYLNKWSHELVKILSYKYLKVVNAYRRKWELPVIKNLEQSFSHIAQIGVVPHEIDFSKNQKIENYFVVGPPITKRAEVSFPWEKLDGRPIVYASFGTIRNKIDKLYTVVIETFKRLPHLQLILSKGAWNGNGFEMPNFPENSIVVDFAPQLEILKKAVLCITHAGPGTILESIYYGVPLIAIPVADDQPAMAARIKYHKIGISIPCTKLNRKKLENSVNQIINSKEINQNVEKMSNKFKKYGGIDEAARVIMREITNITTN